MMKAKKKMDKMEGMMGMEGCGCGMHPYRSHKMKYKGGGMHYCLGFFGALVYFVGNAATFGAVVVGILKAFVWPAFLVYGLLKYLGL